MQARTRNRRTLLRAREPDRVADGIEQVDVGVELHGVRRAVHVQPGRNPHVLVPPTDAYVAALAGIGTCSPRARASATTIARRAITFAMADRYSADDRTSVIGEEPDAAARAASAIASSPPSEPMSAASASETRRIVGASGGDGTGVGHRTGVQAHDGGHPNDGDLHLATVLEADVRGAGRRRRRRDVDPHEQFARIGGGLLGPVQSCSSGSALPRRRSELADAPKHSNGPPVSIAGEAFITLPPIVPCARVAWDRRSPRRRRGR